MPIELKAQITLHHLQRRYRHVLAAALLCVAVLFMGLVRPAAATEMIPSAGEIVLVMGKVQIERAGKTIKLATGEIVASGDRLQTGEDGYLYLKLKDGTFIALRPQSRAVLADYQYVPAATDASSIRVRLQLDEGVMRTITGAGLKKARDRFRLNTPVAAIGVRGTDFTTYTDASTTRVSVAAGGIVMAPLGGACNPLALGPCEGTQSSELFAGHPKLMLQLQRDDLQPSLQPADDQSPDHLRRPLPGEAAEKFSHDAKSDGSVDLQRLSETQTVSEIAAVSVDPYAVDWGRYRSLADQAANVDLAAALKAGREIVATNNYYAILRGAEHIHLPESGKASFSLRHAEASYINNGEIYPASVRGGSLEIDFENSSFSTSLDVVANGRNWDVTGFGDVTSTGHLVSSFRDGSNSTIRGALGGSEAQQAAYVFTRELDTGRREQRLIGVTDWLR